MGAFRQKLKTKQQKTCALARQKSATDSASCTKNVECLPVSVPKSFFLPFKDLSSDTYLETEFLFLNTRTKNVSRRVKTESFLLKAYLWRTSNLIPGLFAQALTFSHLQTR